MKSIHNTMKFMDDKIEELLVKKVDGELSAKEEEFLSLWLAEDVEHERELQVFMAVRQRLSVLREEFRPDISGRLQLVKSRRKKRVHWGLWLRYVAIWILVAGVGGYLLWRDRENVEREHRMFARDAVLADISHEIRTSMNTIVGMTETARAEYENKDQWMQCLKSIDKSVDHLVEVLKKLSDQTE